MSRAAEGPGRPESPSGGARRDGLGQALDRLIPDQLHQQLLWLLLLVSFLLRILWLARPEGGLIFDELYYVNAARVILGRPVAPEGAETPYADELPLADPNREHPPLAKLLVAGSMLLLGDNGYGWRIPSVALGMASILLLYGAARRLSGDPYVALVAASLLAFDNLIFIHSRIFTLDIFQLAFMLLGLYWYLSGRAALAGAGFALAALCKIGGLLGVVALVGYEVLCTFRGDRPWRAGWRPAARRVASMGVVCAAVFLLLLGLMDRAWVGYDQPLEHVQYIFRYGSALRRPAGPLGVGNDSYPWEWLWNEQQMPYLLVGVHITEGEEAGEEVPFPAIVGAMNPFVLHLWPLGLACAAWTWWQRRPGAALGALGLAWFACTYLPFYVATLLGQRLTYLFYFLPTLPAVALAGGYFLVATGLPRLFLWLYLAAVLLGFYGYFPFKPLLL
jgi:predicted membrane-bound dolichyl-phosphate-mannose-protein mannosyltransferase